MEEFDELGDFNRFRPIRARGHMFKKAYTTVYLEDDG